MLTAKDFKLNSHGGREYSVVWCLAEKIVQPADTG